MGLLSIQKTCRWHEAGMADLSKLYINALDYAKAYGKHLKLDALCPCYAREKVTEEPES